MQPFSTLGIACPPGHAVSGRVPVGALPDGTPVTLPIQILHGTGPGPVVCLTATVHGDERTGLFILHAVVAALDPARMRGTVIVFPLVNPLAYISNGRIADLDSSGTNMNRAFPGNPAGSIADRLAATVTAGGISRADYVIDFHDGGIDCATRFAIAHDAADAELAAGNLRLAAAYGIPVVVNPANPTPGMGGMITRAANDLGIPSTCIELGGHGPIDPAAVALGAEGTLRVLGAVGVLDPIETPELPAIQYGDPFWLRANAAGAWSPAIGAADVVREGELVGVVRDVFGEVIEEVRAPRDVAVVSLRVSPVVMTGEWLGYCAPVAG
jgi:predicted deacylase